MRKTFIIFVAITFLSVATLCHADTPLKKLGRGLANVATCFFEVPKGAVDANTTDGLIAALTFGLVKGVFNTGVRAVVGVYETATFLIPIPEDYGPILTDPEFFLEEGLL